MLSIVLTSSLNALSIASSTVQCIAKLFMCAFIAIAHCCIPSSCSTASPEVWDQVMVTTKTSYIIQTHVRVCQRNTHKIIHAMMSFDHTLTTINIHLWSKTGYYNLLLLASYLGSKQLVRLVNVMTFCCKVPYQRYASSQLILLENGTNTHVDSDWKWRQLLHAWKQANSCTTIVSLPYVPTLLTIACMPVYLLQYLYFTMYVCMITMHAL